MSNFRIAAAAALSIAVAGCGGSPRVAHAPQPAPRVAQTPPPRAVLTPQQAPLAAPVSGGESLWHLRAGLNVAALSCRGSGRAGLGSSYARVLSRHRALLASAYAAEQGRYGAGTDRHLTKVYNRFALQRSPQQFCARAANVATEAAAMDSTSLARNAGVLLARID